MSVVVLIRILNPTIIVKKNTQLKSIKYGKMFLCLPIQWENSLSPIDIARDCKPYITNGIQNQYVDTWLTVDAHEPTVVRAFKLDTQAGGDLDNMSRAPSFDSQLVITV